MYQKGIRSATKIFESMSEQTGEVVHSRFVCKNKQSEDAGTDGDQAELDGLFHDPDRQPFAEGPA